MSLETSGLNTVVISGALCTVQDYVIMSQCAHNKAIYLAPEGKVFVTDIPMTQNITIAGTTDFWSTQVFKITLYAKDTQMYLCFNNHWKLVGMKKLQETCYFNESIVHGYFEYRSAVDPNRRVGFTHRGKAIGPKKNVTDACYFFTKIEADRFFHQYTNGFKPHHHHYTSPSVSTSSSSSRKLLPGKSTGKLSSSPSLSPAKVSSLVGSAKSSGGSGYAQRGRDRGLAGSGAGAARNRGSAPRQPNGHNSNLSNSSTSYSRRGNNNLSSTNINHRNHHNNNSHNNNVQQQPTTQLHNTHQHSQSAQHHQIRHHHNDPDFIARRQQYQREHKMQRLYNHQQQSTNNVQRITSEVLLPTPMSSPMLPVLSSTSSLPLSMAASSPIGASVLPPTTLAGGSTPSVINSRRKMRRKKNGARNRQPSPPNAKDLKYSRASKQKKELFKSTSEASAISVEEYLLLSTLSPSTLSTSATVVDNFVSSLQGSSFDKPSTSTGFLPTTLTSLINDQALIREPSPTSIIDESSSPIATSIDPSPSTQFESFESSSLDPRFTTESDDLSLSQSSLTSSSLFDEILPTPQLGDNLMMVMDDRTGGTSTSTDDYSSSSSLSTDSIDISTSSDDTNDSSSSKKDFTVSYSNHNDEYSNDDASTMPVLPNNLDNSMTEYQYSTSSNNRHRNINSSNFKKYYHGGNMGIEKLSRSKKLPNSNTSTGVSNKTPTLATPTATNHSYNNSSYSNKNDNSSISSNSMKANSKSNVSKLSSTEKITTINNSNFDENITNSNNNNQHSSYYSTRSTKMSYNFHNSNLLDSETKKYYMKKTSTTTSSTTTTHSQQLTTSASIATTITTRVPSKSATSVTPSITVTARKSANNVNQNYFYPGEIIEGTYDAMAEDDFISEGRLSGSERKLVPAGYLPTTASLSSLPESIRIAKIKINRERRNRLRKMHIGSK